MIVWHYTYNRFDLIMESGVLLPPSMVPNYYDGFGEAERNAKWYKADKKLLLFSANQVWEPASFRGLSVGQGNVIDLYKLEEYDRLGIHIHRIGVDTSILKPWMRLKSIVRMPRDMGQVLEDIAIRIGSNPIHDWWGTTVPIPRAKWKAVESRINGVWQPVELREAA
jgi:hypothetical protein